MKTLKIINWVILGFYVLFILVSLLWESRGMDAAGRGLANAYLMIVGILFFIMLLLTLSGNKSLMLIGLFIGALPLLFTLYNFVNSEMSARRYAQTRASMNDGTFYFEESPFQKVVASIISENLEDLKSIIDSSDVDLNYLGKRKESLLEIACNHAAQRKTSPSIAIVNYLLESGADPNIATEKTPSILAEVVHVASTELIVILLKHGADPNGRDRHEMSVLHKMMNYGTYKEEDMKLVLSYGADPNIVWNVFGTPLIKAAAAGYWSICDLLINNGADIEYQSKSGFSFLDHYYDAQRFYSRNKEELPEDLKKLKQNPKLQSY